MKHRRWIALLLAAALSLSLFSTGALAAEGEEQSVPAPEYTTSEAEAPEAEAPEAPETAGQEQQQPEAQESEGTVYRVNPAYELSQEELEAELNALDSASLEVQGSTKTVTSVKAAGTWLRKQMKQRKKTISITLKTKKAGGYGLWDEVFDEAVKVTGVPSEGDYLWGNTLSVAGKYRTKYGKTYTHTFSYHLRYTSTAAQEKKVDTAVKKLLTKLDLKGDSDFIKLHKIYNYMCDNITYDYAGLNQKTPGCHSAYAALVKKTAVCQGYATLLCRLLSECGVSCRYVAGTGYDSSGGGPHAWNLVKLGGRYYNADSTWDASLRQSGKYFKYFLRSDANFDGHVLESRYTTAKFKKACPKSSADGNYHYWEDMVIQQPTCSRDGVRGQLCTDCGATGSTEVIPATGEHDWQMGGMEEYYGTLYAWFYCTGCGESSEWLPEDDWGSYYPRD